jgi:hypothetical protein
MSKLLLPLLLGCGLSTTVVTIGHALTEAPAATPQQTDTLRDPDEKSGLDDAATPPTSYPQGQTRSQYLLGDSPDQGGTYNTGRAGDFSLGFSGGASNSGSTYRRY